MPMIQLIKSKILRVEASDTDLTKALKQKIIEDLVHRYQNEEVTSLLDLTSILDPRFKVKYVRNVDVVLTRVKVSFRHVSDDTLALQQLTKYNSLDLFINSFLGTIPLIWSSIPFKRKRHY